MLLPATFWNKVNKGNGCWLWTGSKNNNGYGTTTIKGAPFYAHRAAYIATKGEIPAGLELDHFVCSTRLCVNPDHLRPVTHRENLLRSEGVAAVNASKTHCINGHPFNAENTWHRPGRGRDCLPCRREYKAALKIGRRRRTLLNDEIVGNIKFALVHKEGTHRQIAERFGATVNAVRQISAGNNWKHVAMPERMN